MSCIDAQICAKMASKQALVQMARKHIVSVEEVKVLRVSLQYNSNEMD